MRGGGSPTGEIRSSDGRETGERATTYASVSFPATVLDVIRAVPRGRVASYGAVAAAAGRPGAARAVGGILRRVPEGSDVPWWRVVNARGAITIPPSGFAATLQRVLLEEEGVGFHADGRVDLRACGWSPPGGDETEVA